MKGIILAGGSGTRLYPATKVISKQIIPIYDKPMIYYPLSVLMMGGIKDILIITAPESIGMFQDLLQDGSQWGISFTFIVQPKPEGLAQAFILGKNFIGNDNVTLILGDNIFWGHEFPKIIRRGIERKEGATIFLYWVHDPERYGVAAFNAQGKVVDLEEKPKKPKSNYAVTGLYCYDHHVSEYASTLKPSARGELEITDLNKIYLAKDQLNSQILGRGVAWLDTGTHEAMLQASHFIGTIQERQGLLIASPEEVAFRMGYITQEELLSHGESMKKNSYGSTLIRIAQEKMC